MNSSKENLLIAIRFLKTCVLFAPFVVVFAKDVGMTSSDMMNVFSFFSLLVLILDLPCGHLADKIGNRQALALGMFFYGIGALLIGVFKNEQSMWVAQVFFALGQSIHMGADSGLAYLILKKSSKEKQFASFEGKVTSILSLSGVLICFVGGFLIRDSFRLIFYMTAAIQFLGGCLCYILPNLHSEESLSKVSFIVKGKEFIRIVKNDQVNAISLIGIFLFGSTLRFLLFLVPAEVNHVLESSANSAYFMGFTSLFSFLYFINRHKIIFVHLRKNVPMYFLIAGGFLVMNNLVFIFIGTVFLNIVSIEFMPFLRSYFMNHFKKIGEATAMSLITSGISVFIMFLGPFFSIFPEEFKMMVTIGFVLLGVFGLLISGVEIFHMHKAVKN